MLLDPRDTGNLCLRTWLRVGRSLQRQVLVLNGLANDFRQFCQPAFGRLGTGVTEIQP